MTHFSKVAIPDVMLLLMAMLDDRPGSDDEALQRRAVLGAVKSWAAGARPTPTALEQAFKDIDAILGRFLAARVADNSLSLAVEVIELMAPVQCTRLATPNGGVGGGVRAPRNHVHETVRSFSRASS